MKRRWPFVYFSALAFLGACATSQVITASPTTQQGWRLEQQGDLNGAIEAYSRAIQADPNDWLAYLRRGLLSMKQGLSTQALSDFTQYCRLKPDVADAWATRAGLYDQMGRYAEAVADEDKALALNDLPLYRFTRMKDLFHLGRYTEAISDAEKVANIEDPGQAKTAWLIRAGGLAYTNQSAKAVSAFDGYVARYHEAPEPFFLYPEGVARFEAGQLDRAREIASRIRSSDAIVQYRFDADHALEMFDIDARRTGAAAADALAEKEKAAGHFMEAFQALVRAWTLVPPVTPQDGALSQKVEGEFVALYPLMAEKPVLPEEARRFFVMAKGSVRDATGPAAYHEALLNYNILLAISPWYPPAYYNAAILRAGLGDYAIAVRDMKTYLQLEPNAEDARKVTDQIYEWEAKAR
jgi:tetratricopeptide (TPR) repeat protein